MCSRHQSSFPCSPWWGSQWGSCPLASHGGVHWIRYPSPAHGGPHARAGRCLKETLTPWETHTGAGSWQDGEINPCWSSFAGRICDSMGDPCWSSLNDCTPWKGTMLDQRKNVSGREDMWWTNSNPNSSSSSYYWGTGGREIGSEVEPGKKGGIRGSCFVVFSLFLINLLCSFANKIISLS